MTPKLIVFSDLDGTLLDKNTYSFAAAQPALNILIERHIPLILNSSKTIQEIAALREQLDNTDPFVVENGAAVVIPNDYFEDSDTLDSIAIPHQQAPYRIKRFSKSYAQIIDALSKAREAGYEFAGFNDWNPKELAAISGLDEASAARAKLRQGSEPILLKGDVQKFSKYLNDFNLKTVQGGRFLHVMGHYDKADGVKWLLRAFRDKLDTQDLVSIALGDSHNDIGMLDAVDLPVVIKSEHSEHIKLRYPERAIYSKALGPAGWNETMQKILNQEALSLTAQ